MNNDWMKWFDVDEETKALASSINSGLDKAKRYDQEFHRPLENNRRYKEFNKELLALGDKVKEAPLGVGLCLAGGGAKGAYQIGVYKALISGGVSFSAYSGASVGGINAALFAAGGVPLSDAMWDMINESLLSVKDIVTPDLSNDIELELMIRKSGVLDELDIDAPIASVTAFDEQSGYPKDAILNLKSREDKLKWIMATAAFPIAFEKQIVDGSTLVDGGIPVFGNNVPISPLYYMGVRKSIVVHLSSKNEARSKVSLDLFNNKANEEEYFTGLKALHIYPSEDLGNTFDGTMNFTREYLDHIEDLGFSDGVKALSSLDVLDEELEDDTELHFVDGVRYDSYVQVLKSL